MSRKDLAKAIANVSCPNCSSPLSEMSAFNLMFSTSVGAGKGSPGYLRPETAQSIFLAFPWLLRQNRENYHLQVHKLADLSEMKFLQGKGL